MTIFLRVAVASAAAAMLLAGCASNTGNSGAQGRSSVVTTAATTPAATPAPSIEPAATEPPSTSSNPSLVTGPGYELLLPDGYVQITSEAQLRQLFKARSSALKGAFNAFVKEISQSLVNPAVKMVAMNPNTVSMISLVVGDLDGYTSADLPLMGPELKSRFMRKPGVTSVEVANVTLHGEPALLVTYMDGPSKTSNSTYNLVHNGKLFALRISHVLDPGPHATEDTMLQSLTDSMVAESLTFS
jgi:hypothetical protein